MCLVKRRGCSSSLITVERQRLIHGIIFVNKTYNIGAIHSRAEKKIMNKSAARNKVISVILCEIHFFN